MNRLVIIGNGFDMAHGLNTSYKDFINWYWEQRLNEMAVENSAVSEDCLCRLEILNAKDNASWFSYFYSHSFRVAFTREWKWPPLDIIYYFKERTDEFSVTFSSFLAKILQSIETKGWVDIENDYYQLLKQSAENDSNELLVKKLNEQLDFLRAKLAEYLASISCTESIPTIGGAIKDYLHPEDTSTEGKRILSSLRKSIADYLLPLRRQSIERTMLLCFNYTGTAKMYVDNNITLNYIHGDLEHPKHIIFGYGDELDKDYKSILEKNVNVFLKNVKSLKYLEASNYRKMLDFLSVAPFQVLIMGHSCGNSDRTLLNTVFEHENCVSIKPYYHQRADGSDNYLEIIQNISRNFTNPKLFRDRVVNKERCQVMSKSVRCNFKIKVQLGSFANQVNCQDSVAVDLTEVQFDRYRDTLKQWQSTDEWKNRNVEDGENSFIKRDLPDIYDLIKRKIIEKFPKILEYKDMYSFDQIRIFTADEIYSHASQS